MTPVAFLVAYVAGCVLAFLAGVAAMFAVVLWVEGDEL